MSRMMPPRSDSANTAKSSVISSDGGNSISQMNISTSTNKGLNNNSGFVVAIDSENPNPSTKFKKGTKRRPENNNESSSINNMNNNRQALGDLSNNVSKPLYSLKSTKDSAIVTNRGHGTLVVTTTKPTTTSSFMESQQHSHKSLSIQNNTMEESVNDNDEQDEVITNPGDENNDDDESAVDVSYEVSKWSVFSNFLEVDSDSQIVVNRIPSNFYAEGIRPGKENALYHSMDFMPTLVLANPSLTRRFSSISGSSIHNLEQDSAYRTGLAGYHEFPCPRDVEDIDLRRAGEPIYCVEYAKDVFSYLRSLQFKYRLSSPNFLRLHQPEVTPHMRSILVDWLVEVAEEYTLLPDTLYLCVNYLDRALDAMPINKLELQLLGCACMLIAAKYEEIFPPLVQEFVDISDNSFSRQRILDMEVKVLQHLRYGLNVSTCKLFLRRFQRAARVSLLERNLSNYLAELTLQEYDFLEFASSLIAASAIFLARVCIYHMDAENESSSSSSPLQQMKERDTDLQDDVSMMNVTQESSSGMRFSGRLSPKSMESYSSIWNAELEHYTGYTAYELAHCIRRLWMVHSSAPLKRLLAVYNKYSKDSFMRVASIRPCPEHLLPVITEKAILSGGR